MLELSDDALLDTIYSSVEPNPDRVGCPPREALRELAMRTRPLSDPLWDHVMECAPCRIDVREMGRDRPATPVRSPARSVGLAAAAILVLIDWSRRLDPHARSGSTHAGHRRPSTVCGDALGSARSRANPRFDLPRRLVRLTLLLPNGSEPGPYDIEVRGTDGRGTRDRVRTCHAPGFHHASCQRHRLAIGAARQVSACDSTNWGRLADFSSPNPVASSSIAGY